MPLLHFLLWSHQHLNIPHLLIHSSADGGGVCFMFCLLWTVLLWTFVDSNFNSKSSSESTPITSDTFTASVWCLLIKIYISHRVPLFDPISFSGSLLIHFLSHSFATEPTCLSTLHNALQNLPCPCAEHLISDAFHLPERCHQPTPSACPRKHGAKTCLLDVELQSKALILRGF